MSDAEGDGQVSVNGGKDGEAAESGRRENLYHVLLAIALPVVAIVLFYDGIMKGDWTLVLCGGVLDLMGLLAAVGLCFYRMARLGLTLAALDIFLLPLAYYGAAYAGAVRSY